MVLLFIWKYVIHIDYISIQCVREGPKFIISPDDYIAAYVEYLFIDLKCHLYHLLNFFIYLDLFIGFPYVVEPHCFNNYSLKQKLNKIYRHRHTYTCPCFKTLVLHNILAILSCFYFCLNFRVSLCS